MNDNNWKNVQEKTGTDIVSIVMDVLHDRITAGQAMNRIAEHCEACYAEGAMKSSEGMEI